MAEDDDWRLTGQERYLTGITLVWRRYTHYPHWNLAWDHDHCDFCWAKFMDTDTVPEVLREGYTNAAQVINGTHCSEGNKWICPQCFDDFCHRFDWMVVGNSGG